jgi:adenine deaminase
MSVLLKNACILDANHDFVIKDILTGDKTIISVEDPGLAYPAADNIIDFSGYTVLPGFIDAHIHVAVDKTGFSDTALKAWVQNGVTTVRDLGMLNNLPLEDYAAWIKTKTGPEYARVLSAGKYIDKDYCKDYCLPDSQFENTGISHADHSIDTYPIHYSPIMGMYIFIIHYVLKVSNWLRQ